MPTRPRTSRSPRAGAGTRRRSGAGSAICRGRRRGCWFVRSAMPVVEGLMGSTLPARPAGARTGSIAPAAASSPATSQEDRADEPEDDEQEEQADEEPEEPEQGMPAPAPAVAIGGDDDWSDGGSSGCRRGRHRRGEARLVGGGGDDAAADHEDGDEEDRCKDSLHDPWTPLSVRGIHHGSRCIHPPETLWRGDGGRMAVLRPDVLTV